MEEKKNRIKTFIYSNKWLISILFLCFIFSISYSFYFKIEPAVDAEAYNKIAQNIVFGNGYKEEPIIIPENLDNALLRVGPVYEYFLAGIYYIFGFHYEIVWFFQALLRVASVVFVYLSTLIIFQTNPLKKRIAVISSAIFAFYPDLIEISAMLMTETLYVFFVCLFIYLFFKYTINDNLFILLSLAVVSGLSVLARPPVLFCLPLVLLFFILRRRWRDLFIYMIILVLVFTPWTIRNYYLYEDILPFGSAGSLNLWIGNHVGSNGEQEMSPEIIKYLQNNEVRDVAIKSEMEFKDYIFNNPEDFTKLTLSRINKYFSVLRPMGFWFYNSGIEQILFVLSSAIFSFFVLVFGLSGIIYAIITNEKSIRYLLGFTVITPLVIFITVVETRYRFQIYSFLSIFSAYFISSWNKDVIIKRKWYTILIITISIILLNGFIDGAINFNHFRDKLSNYL